MRIAAGADSLELGVHENQVVFVADGVTLTTRRIGQRVRVRLLRRGGARRTTAQGSRSWVASEVVARAAAGHRG